MKKVFLLLIFMLGIGHVKAITETDVTGDTNIKYRWYKEVISDELYYPKKDVLPDYFEDRTKVEYGSFSEWGSEYCNYSDDNYLIERKLITSYDKLDKVKYVLIANASATCPTGRCTNEVRVYYNFMNLDYKVLKDSYFGLFLELPDYYEPEKLLFYINTEHCQVIYLSKNNTIPPIMIASPASKENIQVINDSWEANDDAYIHVTDSNLDIPLIKNIQEEEICRVREIKTYRYKVEREYYDNEYYLDIDGYIPDIADYRVIYMKEFPKTKEVLKNILVPKIEKEYVYLPSEEVDGERTEIVYQTKYIDKIVDKIPLKMYILITMLGIVIVLLVIKLLSKRID